MSLNLSLTLSLTMEVYLQHSVQLLSKAGAIILPYMEHRPLLGATSVFVIPYLNLTTMIRYRENKVYSLLLYQN